MYWSDFENDRVLGIYKETVEESNEWWRNWVLITIDLWIIIPILSVRIALGITPLDLTDRSTSIVIIIYSFFV